MKKELGIAVLLLVLCSLVAILNPQFLGATNLQNMTRLVGIYGIFSMGLGIVIITGGIDLSVGSLFALVGVLFCMAVRGEIKHPEWFEFVLRKIHLWDYVWRAVTVCDNKVWPWPVALIAAILGSMALGAAHGYLVTKVKLQPFIVTLCGLLIYRGAARYVTNDQTENLSGLSFPFLKTVCNEKLHTPGIASLHLPSFNTGIPNVFLLMLAVAAIMWVVLHRSVYGRYLFAVGRNEEAARYSGINVKLVIGSAYVVCMALAGLSGVLLIFYIPSISPAGHGQSYELYGIAAAVLGGCSLRGGEGSILGIVLGTILLQVLQNLVIILGINDTLNFAVLGSVILVGVTIDQILKSRKGKMTGPVTTTATSGSTSEPRATS